MLTCRAGLGMAVPPLLDVLWSGRPVGAGIYSQPGSEPAGYAGGGLGLSKLSRGLPPGKRGRVPSRIIPNLGKTDNDFLAPQHQAFATDSGRRHSCYQGRSIPQRNGFTVS